MELYSEQGFERTTVAEIAERAALTERTFFRHFTDKKEVPFSGASAFQEFLVAHVGSAPVDLSPLETVLRAFSAVGAAFFEPRPHDVRVRQRIIEASAELRERELIKMTAVTEVLTEVLNERGCPRGIAQLAASSGVTVFMVAFADWTNEPDGRSLQETLLHVTADLHTVIAPL